MKETQKQTMKKIAENVKNWNEEQKSFLLGFVEGVTQFNKLEEVKKNAQGQEVKHTVM